jgi:pimeloyl-ACP methyl ester carboxylesterase
MSLFSRLPGSSRVKLASVAFAVAAAMIPAGFLPALALPSVTSARHPHAAKPTIVLVHGAWADASSFAPVTERLQADGYTVLAEANPLRGLKSDADYLSAFLAQATSGPVILVGHSYGGAVITNAALTDPDVKGLVYLDGFVPDVGESALGILTAAGAGADPDTLFNVVSYPGAPKGDYDLYLKPEVVPVAFANGLPARTAARIAASQRPPTLAALLEPSKVAAWKSLPSWYVLGTQDRLIPPALQQSMAERAGSKITRVKTGHVDMLGAPRTVTRVIEKAARATS